MTLSGKTIARLAEPFEGGAGPSHATINRAFASAEADGYLSEGNKMDRVLSGLRALRDGRRAAAGQPALPPNHDKLREVAAELATTLLAYGAVDEAAVAEALGEDGESTRESDDQPRTAGTDTRPASGERPGAPLPARANDTRRVLVVHGQDAAATKAMFDWLRSIDLRPAEWNQLVKASGAASPFIGDVVEKAFQQAQAVVVLFTPDERVQLHDDIARGAQSWRLQARPNVLFEAGMAFATHPLRTALVVLGDQELPSDLAGRHYVRLGTPKALTDLAERLETAGCPVDRSGADWLDVDRFPSRKPQAEPS